MIHRIAHDVYNIANRIKDIDRDYYIVYNTDCSRFEVHHSSQIGSTYCCSVPYNALDERTLNYVYMTQSTNIENILEDIDRENKLRENAEKSCVLSRFNDSIENTLKEIY